MILFHLGPVPVFAYGVSLAVGFSIAVWFLRRWAKASHLDPEWISELALVALLSGIVGARVLYVLTEWSYFLQQPLAIFKLWEGGLVFYGGLMAGVSISVWKIRKAGLPLWKVADLLAPGIALAHGVGRIGCFLNGCCYGEVSYSWGFAIPFLGDGIPRVPVQLIEAAGLLALAWWLRKFARAQERISTSTKVEGGGAVFFRYLLFYAMGRFGLEFIRADDRGPQLFEVLSISQFISVGLAVWAVLRLRR